MTEIIGVRFKKVGKIYYFDPAGVQVIGGTKVIVETSRGIECGDTVIPNRDVADDSIVQPLKKLVRVATDEDLVILAENERLEKEAFSICEQKIKKHELSMKLVAVEYTFDHSKILFYFSAEGRVDFRDLVKDLASVFRTRIELRQIGVRDAAKMIGGLGICGCPLCCNTFLDDFDPVSINMAKDQGLSLNPSKISGTCGRLMCCLKYENEAYQELMHTSPTSDSLVETPKGKGTVMDVSLLKGSCKVRLQSAPDSPEIFKCEECKILRRGRTSNQNQNSEPIDKTALQKLQQE
ncbi:MAG: stage 0 sporulation family protein [Clostridiaceae bacterium]|nr:stage 0 sporulation family protein [Clostridiaceae bacterium]